MLFNKLLSALAMNESSLKGLLETELNTDIDFVSYTKGIDHEKISIRERQLSVFSRRSASLKRLDKLTTKQSELLPKIEKFVNRLEELTDPIELYCWKAKSGNNRWGGWCTKDEILYSIEREYT